MCDQIQQGMRPPENTSLPFFAYGIFRPGQLGFLRLKDMVAETKLHRTVTGELLLRDGLPIINPSSQSEVDGDILIFDSIFQVEAYQRIAEIEPDKQYRWDTVLSNGEKVNILFGRSPNKGSVPCEVKQWDGKKDPLFDEALQVVDETLQANREFSWDLKPLFRLQMAYMLLWSSIERYASLRYHLGKDVTNKISHIATENSFAEILPRFVASKREVFSAADPGTKVTLDPANPEKSLKYYYQIRSNITHRGKAVVKDYETLKQALEELLPIFYYVLAKGFEESTINQNESD